MQLLLNHISFHQQSNTNSLTSTEYNNIKTLGECHEKLDINVVKETEWNQQSEFTRVTSTAYYSVVLAVVTLTHIRTNTKSQKYSNFNTTTNQLLRYDRVWAYRWMALARRFELFLSYLLLPPNTANMTLSPSLLANGRQLRCLRQVISHCLLCPVKLSTELFMA